VRVQPNDRTRHGTWRISIDVSPKAAVNLSGGRDHSGRHLGLGPKADSRELRPDMVAEAIGFGEPAHVLAAASIF
jgi:hypothetical protein